MKIRIKTNSVRYRLNRTDVQQLASTGYLEDKVAFWQQTLVYAIQAADTEELSSSFKNNVITLYVPQTMIDELESTERVGFENNNGPVHLLVEKDFTCLENVAEDQGDNYPNPLAVKYDEQRR